MAVYFNDLTIVKDDPSQNCRLLPEFWKVMKRLKQATDGREDRVLANDDALSLGDAVYASGDPELMMYYSTFFARAYQDDDSKELMARAADHTGGEAEYHLADGSRDQCDMLGWAYHERAITLGLASSAYWGRLAYPVERVTLEDEEPVLVEALCVTAEKQIETSRVLGWIAAQRDFENVGLPEKCTLKPEEKHIKVQMHHGRDEMMAFAEKLCRHPLIQGVIDNIAFDSTTNRFVLNCYDDGVVDLRMHWTERGYGLKVQTTARGLPQTQLVADVLREKFDRKS